jgi:3-hydroxybutyryl-CoA dehydrogenase
VPPVNGKLPEVVGVVGAGTMGAGIAQLAATAGARTLLHDPVPDALERGVQGIRRRLERAAERGRMDAAEARAAAERLEGVDDIAKLAPCGLVIEAAPERLELKREIFGALAEAVEPDALLATNTSSLSVTAIAAGVPGPERVVGMHFFNPAPIMRLVEVVAGEASSEEAVPPTWPASSSTAATARSAWRRCGSCRSAWPRPSRSIASAGSAAASRWARSS